MSWNAEKEANSHEAAARQASPLLELPSALAMQIDRVLARINRAEQGRLLQAPAGIIAAFRTRGLIPPALVSFFKLRRPRAMEASSCLTEELLAVCFAACVFPQRAYQMEETQFTLQAEAFLKAVESLDLQGAANPPSADRLVQGLIAMECLPASMGKENTLALLADLSAADCVPAFDTAAAAKEQGQRRLGAALYLACCHKELTERLVQTWNEEAMLVRYLRRYMVTTPSNLTRQDQSSVGRPHWDAVERELTRLLPDVPVELHQQAIILEKMMWSFASARVAPQWLSDGISNFWESLWAKLISGFPYYAFRSRFGYWCKQCLRWYDFTDPLRGARETKDNLGLPQEIVTETPPQEITPEQLRWFREGYRLVRTTFFKRQHNPQLDGADHESLRLALDTIWYHRLETCLGDGLSEQRVKQISARFPDLDKGRVSTLTLHLRLRMWAYALARISRFSNSRILSAKRPAGYGRRGANDHPLRDEPTVLTIASLARAASLDGTLLWALGAHVFLRPKVEPQHLDKWTFKRFLRELWLLLKEDTFNEAMQAEVESGSRVNAAALGMLTAAPLDSLVADLRRAQTDSEMSDALSGPDLRSEEMTLLAAVRQLARDDSLSSAGDAAVRAYRKEAQSSRHWIVPVWYLAILEQLDERQILERLQVDEDDVGIVLRLSRMMAARRNKGTSL